MMVVWWRMLHEKKRERERKEEKMKVLIKISLSCHYHSLILVFHFLTLNKYGKYIFQGEIIIFSLSFLALLYASFIQCSQRSSFFDIFLSNNISSSSRSKYSEFILLNHAEKKPCRNRIIWVFKQQRLVQLFMHVYDQFSLLLRNISMMMRKKSFCTEIFSAIIHRHQIQMCLHTKCFVLCWHCQNLRKF